jgi:type VI secretion system secreted protein Hcp
MAVDMFIKIGDIKGESQDKKHLEEIDVLAWSWGMSNSGTTHMGGGGGAGKVSVQDISFTKYVDSASNALIMHCCQGKHVPKVTLICRKAGGTAIEFIEIDMEDAIVTAVSTGGSGGEDRLTENVTLNFSKFKYTYRPQKADGSADADKDATWDMAANVEK